MPVGALSEMGVDVEAALERVNVPSYVIDRAGVVRWINEAGRRIVGDQVGRQFTSVVAPEETHRAREIFTSKVVGNSEVTDAAMVVVDTEGRHISVEISSVPLRRGEHVVGVFGQVSDVLEEPHTHPELRLTPRQAEVCGCSSGAARPRRSPKSWGSAVRRSGITCVVCWTRSERRLVWKPSLLRGELAN